MSSVAEMQCAGVRQSWAIATARGALPCDMLPCTSGPPSRPTQYILELPNSAYSGSPQCNISHETTSYNLDESPEKNLG